MNKLINLSAATLIAIGVLPYAQANEFEVRGNIELQGRFFTEDALFPDQKDSYLSVAAEPEFFWSWNDGKDSFEFVPFARVDQYDSERTHSDIRELSWVHVGDNWESRIGIRREFWGVTEFQHLVDIINQQDFVEDIDNEDRLGQPMINLSLVNDWGIVDLFVLPGFREQTFPAVDGRPGFPFVDIDNPLYESSDKDKHVDLAVRWAHSVGDFDLGLSVFKGTSRLPLYLPAPGAITLPVQLVPYYRQITQLGFEMQATVGDTLWKLEVINNQNNVENYSALQGGFEHTLYGVFDSNADLGWLMEYGWDERGSDLSSFNQNDLFFGSRLAVNDVDSTELLFGFGYDLDFDSTSVIIEGSKRFGDSVQISLDVRLFSADDLSDPLYLFSQDDQVQLSAQYFY